MAPVALIAVLVAVILIVRARTGTHPTPAPPVSHQILPTREAPRAAPRYYVVMPRDTLSEISVKTHVPLATLESLNPSIDPNALRAGQRLRLR
jgi:hypothetical protein